MNKTYIIAILAGIAGGYLLGDKLKGYRPFTILYAKGASFAA